VTIAAPQYVIGEDQPGGAQRYVLNGVYPGYIVGTGGAADVKTAMDSLANLVGGSNVEVIKWSGSLGSLSCGAPFSNSGYDGTLNALSTGSTPTLNQHVVLGLPLCESITYNQPGNTTSGSSTIALTAPLPSTYLTADISGPGVPTRSYVSGISGNNITISSYATGAAVAATSSNTSVNFSFTWKLHHVAAGALDAKFTAIATAMVARGWTRQRMTVLLGWEMDGAWAWGTSTYDPSTNANQTPAQYIAAFQHVVTVMRAVSGFTNRFEWNTKWNDGGSGMAAGYPGDAYCDVIGWDAYNTINNASLVTDRTDFNMLWTLELKPALDRIVAAAASRDAARAGLSKAPLMVGHSECGMIIWPNAQSGSSNYKFHGSDNGLYWQYMHDYWAAHADRFAYIIFFNQNQTDINKTVTTEDNQLFYSGSTSGQTALYTHNTSTHGPWAWTTSTYHTLGLPAYQTYMIAGTMQLQDVGLPARNVAVSDNTIYNFFYPFG
jgi:hypothetical protein